MDETHVERRLAAILVADIVGYSRLMAEDEAATVAALIPAVRRATADSETDAADTTAEQATAEV